MLLITLLIIRNRIVTLLLHSEVYMEKVMIIDGLRTSMGRSKNGIFRHVRADTLSAEVMSAVIKRNNINAADIDDIIWGVQQTGEQGLT